MKVGFFSKDQEQKSKRKVSKAFLITGGTEETRQEKFEELYSGDGYLMYADYKGENELAVIFSAHHSDFEGMTFEEAKKLAGLEELGHDYRTSTFGREQRFGVINITGSEEKLSFS